mmetsp:Transcript_27418/g.67384  ORF Transcript_27418/g.67384 Transcript_27418/m.67384 type:complete len:215 (+) Transcript_27418:325-969(+)
MASKISIRSALGSSSPCFVGMPRIGARRRRTAVVVALMSFFSDSRRRAAEIWRSVSPFSFSCSSSNSSDELSYSPSSTRQSPMSSCSTSYSFMGDTMRSSSKDTVISSLGSCTRAKRMYASSCRGMRSANTGNCWLSADMPMPSRICVLAVYRRSVVVVLALNIMKSPLWLLSTHPVARNSSPLLRARGSTTVTATVCRHSAVHTAETHSVAAS